MAKFVSQALLATALVTAALIPATAQEKIPNFASDATVGWLAAGTEFIAMETGPQPVGSDPAYPYVPNGRGAQPTFRVADLNNPILQPWVKDALPVRIARSALAQDVPCADLFVTQAHALFFDGVLVTAGSLINGTTISLYDVRDRDELVYYHIKLETHDVIYAEGAPCETLLEVDENASNFAEYFRTYGVPPIKAILCVPLLSYNGGGSEIKSRLRSALSPLIDRREKIDVIRDHLEERAVSLS